MSIDTGKIIADEKTELTAGKAEVKKAPPPSLSQGGNGGLASITRRVALDSLHPDPANARKHDERNIAAISASLRQFGQVEPLVVQASTGKVIGGNGRLEAMRKDGATHADVVELDIDDTQATALGIALNRIIDVGAKYVPGYQLRYVYFLDPAYRAKLSVPEVAFSEIQKRGAGMYRGQSRAGSDPVDTPGVQPGEGGSTPTPALSLCEGVALA